MLVSQGAASLNACDRDYAHLHFVRAFLMCLGFLLHATLFCTAGGDAFQALFDLIHSFRMECFFVIAGFFSARTLGRKSPRVFLLRRCERLGIPLIFCTIVFAVLDHLFPSLGIRPAWIVVPGGPVRAELASHLWFLRTLVILVSAMFVLRVARPGLDSWLKEFRVTPAVFLVSLAGANFLTLHWTHGLHPEYWHLPHLISNLDSAIIYTPWFAAGYILFHHEDLLERIASLLLFNTLNIGAFLLLRPSLEGTVFGHYLAQAWQGAFIVSVFGLLFWCSRRFFGNPPAGVQAVANAS
jgi:glucan biosynthesis protein C